jgi:hypothetical protein
MMSDKTVIRIEIEYSDGTLERATGEDANKIWAAIEGGFALQHIHGMTYTGPKLIAVERPAAQREREEENK